MVVLKNGGGVDKDDIDENVKHAFKHTWYGILTFQRNNACI